MALLKKKHLPFGLSCCYTSQNLTPSAPYESYFDQMGGVGRRSCGTSTICPVGNDAVPELLPTPEQRNLMYHRIRGHRGYCRSSPWTSRNDGEYVGGRIAGGRRYLHINANGDAIPACLSTIPTPTSGT